MVFFCQIGSLGRAGFQTVRQPYVRLNDVRCQGKSGLLHGLAHTLEQLLILVAA
jgi:hypothetical protein